MVPDGAAGRISTAPRPYLLKQDRPVSAVIRHVKLKIGASRAVAVRLNDGFKRADDRGWRPRDQRQRTQGDVAGVRAGRGDALDLLSWQANSVLDCESGRRNQCVYVGVPDRLSHPSSNAAPELSQLSLIHI